MITILNNYSSAFLMYICNCTGFNTLALQAGVERIYEERVSAGSSLDPNDITDVEIVHNTCANGQSPRCRGCFPQIRQQIEAHAEIYNSTGNTRTTASSKLKKPSIIIASSFGTAQPA